MEEQRKNVQKDDSLDEPNGKEPMNIHDNVVRRESKKCTVENAYSERMPVDYDDEEGSLEKDIALHTHKIPDDHKRWEEVEPSGGVRKLVLKEGYGETPKEGEKVSCYYSGFLRSNGQLFDSSRESGDIFKFDIGKGSVIKGWDKGVATMKVGERAVLRCTSDYAYGDRGSEPKIPAKATLDFIVELKGIHKYEAIWGTDDAKDSILKKTIIKVDEWERANKLWVVTVTYTGRENDENGRIWCNGKNEKVRIPIDSEFEKKGVIPDYDQPRGFYVCLQNTKKGEQNNFKLKSNDYYTYGSAGSRKFKIAPNTDLFYDITVTDMQKFNMSAWQLDEKEKISKALELKEIANDFFRRKKLTAANEVYKDILEITKSVKEEETDKEKANEISLFCHCNKALVETQLNNLSEASEHIKEGLAINPKHEKLRYRKAFLQFKQGEFKQASDLLAVLEEEFPLNRGIKALAIKNNRANKESRKRARKLAKKMFGPSATKKLKKNFENGLANAANIKAMNEEYNKDDKAVEGNTGKKSGDKGSDNSGVESDEATIFRKEE